MRRILAALLFLIIPLVFACSNDGKKVDLEGFEKSISGKCDDTSNGNTFSYSWLRSEVEKWKGSGFTPAVVDCIVDKALNNRELYVKDGCLTTAAFVYASECGFRVDTQCLDGYETVPETPGLCKNGAGEKICYDGTTPIDGRCSLVPFALLCADGSLPKDGICPLSTSEGERVLGAAEGIKKCENCAFTIQVRRPKNYPSEIVDELRKYLTTNSMLANGSLFARFCGDQDCKKPLLLVKFAEVKSPLTGKVYEFEVPYAPVGESWMQVIFDTEYSKKYGDPCNGLDNCPGPFDVLSTGVDTITPNANGSPKSNPEPISYQINAGNDNAPKVDKVFNIGSFVFDRSFYISPKDEDAPLFVTSSGEDSYRNVVRIVEMKGGSYNVSKIDIKKDNAPFKGDLCGMVPGDADDVYVLGYGASQSDYNGYVFRLVKEEGSWKQDQSEIVTVNGEKDNEPHPCRGVLVKRGDKKFLYMVEFKGAGGKGSALPYPVMGIDLNSNALVEYGNNLPIKDSAANRAITGITSDNKYVYVIQASWSGVNDKPEDRVNKVWRFKIGDDGKLSTVDENSGRPTPIISEGDFNNDDVCPDTNQYPPAFASYMSGDKKYLVVGTKDSLVFYDIDKFGAQGVTSPGATDSGADNPKVTEIKLGEFGRFFTSVSFSPDGKKMYALPVCTSEHNMSIQKGLDPQSRFDVNRQLIAVIDITKDQPSLIDGTEEGMKRDFDEDGQPEPYGSIDLQFTNIKKNILRWVEDATGALPPIAYIGPEIAVGGNNVFLRGAGVEGKGGGVSGLGQVADIGAFDIQSGNGIVFRNYVPWLNATGKGEDVTDLSAGSYWGIDLDPKMRMLSTGGLLYYAGKDAWIVMRGFEPGESAVQIDYNKILEWVKHIYILDVLRSQTGGSNGQQE